MEKTPRYTEGGTRDPRNPEQEPAALQEAKAHQKKDEDDDGSSPGAS